MRLKAGASTVRLSLLLSEQFPVLKETRREAMRRLLNTDPVLTSGSEGHVGDNVHGQGSLHYPENCPENLGLAVDLRTKDFAELWADLLRKRLGPGWDVVVEGDHLHVERDPKKLPLQSPRHEEA